MGWDTTDDMMLYVVAGSGHLDVTTKYCIFPHHNLRGHGDVQKTRYHDGKRYGGSTDKPCTFNIPRKHPASWLSPVLNAEDEEKCQGMGRCRGITSSAGECGQLVTMCVQRWQYQERDMTDQANETASIWPNDPQESCSIP